MFSPRYQVLLTVVVTSQHANSLFCNTPTFPWTIAVSNKAELCNNPPNYSVVAETNLTEVSLDPAKVQGIAQFSDSGFLNLSVAMASIPNSTDLLVVSPS